MGLKRGWRQLSDLIASVPFLPYMHGPLVPLNSYRYSNSNECYGYVSGVGKLFSYHKGNDSTAAYLEELAADIVERVVLAGTSFDQETYSDPVFSYDPVFPVRNKKGRRQLTDLIASVPFWSR